jgi:hypothetical protein
MQRISMQSKRVVRETYYHKACGYLLNSDRTAYFFIAKEQNCSALTEQYRSLFLRSVADYPTLDNLHLSHVKIGMLVAEKNNDVFHLSRHPCNAALSPLANLNHLEKILMYYPTLNHNYYVVTFFITILESSCRPH